MSQKSHNGRTAQMVEQFIRGLSGGGRRAAFRAEPLWGRLGHLGTELWLDTGSMEEADALWTQEFSALTTNNTLLNKEVQTGRYDEMVAQAAALLAGVEGLDERRKLQELAFILNAHHGRRLVDRFGAYVSVEEHTDFADDVEGAVEVGRRYHALCPERFIIKIPFTPAGLLATRRLVQEEISVNHTLGFSARQNYIVTRVAQPAFVNVFLGRLNSFAVENKLGDGQYVGEKATLASQRMLRELHGRGGCRTRQIGASFRAGTQVRDLAGIDVMTMPPKVARQFMDLGMMPNQLEDRSRADYQPVITDAAAASQARLETLWDVPAALVECVDNLLQENLDAFTPRDLVNFFSEHKCGDVLVDWTVEQKATSMAEGKIPRLATWREILDAGAAGLDSLMNLAGLMSFTADQEAMDRRVADVLSAKDE